MSESSSKYNNPDGTWKYVTHYYSYAIGDFKSFTLNLPFLCEQCGNCCRNVKASFSQGEPLKIMRFIGMNPENETDRVEFLDKYVSSQLGLKSPCAFLNGNLCSIEPVKPNECKMFTGERFVKKKRTIELV